MTQIFYVNCNSTGGPSNKPFISIIHFHHLSFTFIFYITVRDLTPKPHQEPDTYDRVYWTYSKSLSSLILQICPNNLNFLIFLLLDSYFLLLIMTYFIVIIISIIIIIIGQAICVWFVSSYLKTRSAYLNFISKKLAQHSSIQLNSAINTNYLLAWGPVSCIIHMWQLCS